MAVKIILNFSVDRFKGLQSFVMLLIKMQMRMPIKLTQTVTVSGKTS